MTVTKHLDLGCGRNPHNPYDRQQLFGVDLHEGWGEDKSSSIEYKQANLALEPIPFDADTFDSVSAFDFIEHIPRQLAVDGQIRLPFIELMNEIWRVLKPNGVLCATIPAYPLATAFVDPTHVNIITNKTHRYFCGEDAYGRIYGFRGNFHPVRVEWTSGKSMFTSERNLRSTLRTLHRRYLRKDLSTLAWELRAVK